MKGENKNEKNIILEEFETLYHHTEEKIIPASILAKNLIHILYIILRDNKTKKLPPPQILKSTFKDTNGFNQREIAQLVNSDSLHETALRAKQNRKPTNTQPQTNLIKTKKETFNHQKT